MAFVTATAALENYWSDNKFQAAIQKKALTIEVFLDKLVASYPDAKLTRRGRGMMQGIACEDSAVADRITTIAFQNGLIIETSGGEDEVVKLLMPLTIEQETLLAGLDILEHAVAEAVGEKADARVESDKEVTA